MARPSLLNGNHVINMPVAPEASESYKIASTNAFLLTTENISGNFALFRHVFTSFSYISNVFRSIYRRPLAQLREQSINQFSKLLEVHCSLFQGASRLTQVHIPYLNSTLHFEGFLDSKGSSSLLASMMFLIRNYKYNHNWLNTVLSYTISL